MADSDLKAGVYWRGITPPLGIDLCGYGDYADRKAMSGVKSLHAQALVLEHKQKRVALVTLDLIGLSEELVRRTQELIEKMTGIPRENVILACSHTHSGPVTVDLIGSGEPDYDYLSMLTRQIASAVVQACDELEYVNVFSGQATLIGLAKNRAQSDGVIDTAVQTLEFLSSESDCTTVLFSFGCHPVSTPKDDIQLNPDFPARARTILQSEYDDALFLQGSCGDIEPIFAHENEIGRAGQMLAGAALMAVGGAKQIESLRPLRVVSRTIDLPTIIPVRSELERKRDDYRALLTEREPNTPEGKKARFFVESSERLLQRLEQGNRSGRTSVLPCTVTAIQIGDVVILTHPCELFAEFGLELRRNSPFRQTFIIGYANGYLGYIPNEAEFVRKGYAAEVAPARYGQFPFAPNVGRVFADACLAFLMELYQGK